jgi:hypothetical protein
MKFKKGDRVRCINAGRINGVHCQLLVEGAVYEVHHQPSDTNVFVMVNGRDMYGFFPQRFELAPSFPRTVAHEHRSDVRPGPTWGVR